MLFSLLSYVGQTVLEVAATQILTVGLIAPIASIEAAPRERECEFYDFKKFWKITILRILEMFLIRKMFTNP